MFQINPNHFPTKVYQSSRTPILGHQTNKIKKTQTIYFIKTFLHRLHNNNSNVKIYLHVVKLLTGAES